jgi:hypothetical protein
MNEIARDPNRGRGILTVRTVSLGIGNATWKRRRVLRDFRLGAATIPFERVVTGGI